MGPAGTGNDARRALLERLIDHAALFPPASHPLERALELDRAARAGAESWMLGCFVCPASQLEALALAADGTLPVSVVLDGAATATVEDWLDVVAADLSVVTSAGRALAVEMLEARLPATVPAPELVSRFAEQVGAVLPGRAVRVFLELPIADDWRQAVPAGLEAIARGGADATPAVGAKVRCGGAVRSAFPSPAQLARFVAACNAREVPFKATAGLHHPIRHTAPDTGFPTHGFLNILAAAVFAHALDLGEDELTDVLAEEDRDRFRLTPESLSLDGRSAPADAIARARSALFVGYGSCSFDEPVEDLRALGVLPS